MKIARIEIDEPGAPEAMTLREHTLDALSPDAVRVRHSLIAVNFIDTYHRSGLYALDADPVVPGVEAVGVLEAVGDDVREFSVGDRVVYLHRPPGSYATHRDVPASSVVALPEEIGDEQASSLMVRGLTAWYLLFRTYPLRASSVALVHAAAGGMGLLLGAWGRELGATLYGTASTEEKVRAASDAGYAEVIRYDQRSFVDEIERLTGGRGVDVVYDGVGRATFSGSLDCVRRRGMMITFGNASGPVDPIEPAVLAQKGSLFLTRPSLFDYVADEDEFRTGCDALFEVVRRGVLAMPPVTVLPLAEAARAHRMLEAREVTGTLALKPA